METTAPSYYEAESLAMVFIDSHRGECYTECESDAIYVYDATSRELLLKVGYK